LLSAHPAALLCRQMLSAPLWERSCRCTAGILVRAFGDFGVTDTAACYNDWPDGFFLVGGGGAHGEEHDEPAPVHGAGLPACTPQQHFCCMFY
jgi:hypothetical protein